MAGPYSFRAGSRFIQGRSQIYLEQVPDSFREGLRCKGGPRYIQGRHQIHLGEVLDSFSGDPRFIFRGGPRFIQGRYQINSREVTDSFKGDPRFMQGRAKIHSGEVPYL